MGDLDANSILSVSAQDKNNQSVNKSIRIEQQKGRLSTEEIERIVQEAEKYKQEDIARRAKVDAKNQLENVLYQTKNQLGEKIPSVNSYCDEVIQWLEDAEDPSTEELQAKMKEFQDRVQQEVQANGGQATGGEAQQEQDDRLNVHARGLSALLC